MRLFGFVFALFTLAQPAHADTDLLVCRVTGAVMHACCCPDQPTHNASVIERAGCCDGVHLEATAQASRVVEHGGANGAPAAVFSVLPSVAVVRAPAPMLARGVGADPRTTTGPPRVPVYLAILHLLG